MGNGGFIVDSTPFTVGDAKFTLLRLVDTFTPGHEKAKIILHCHLFYEIRMATKGSYEYCFKNESITLKSGEMLIIPPSTYHYSRLPDNSFSETVCSISVEKVNGSESFFDTFKALIDENSLCIKKYTPSLEKSVREYFDFAEKNTDDSFGTLCSKQLLAGNVVKELAQLLGTDAAFTHSSEEKSKKTDTGVLLELITASGDMTLAEIARHMNYSVKHTARLIKEQYGKPYRELVRTRKLESAKKLLADSDMPINTIAKTAGYHSSTSFCRDIKNDTGMTPSQFREKERKK